MKGRVGVGVVPVGDKTHSHAVCAQACGRTLCVYASGP